MKTAKLLIILAIVFFAFQAHAEIYKYTDDDGNVHYTDDVNQVPEDQRDSYEPSIESHYEENYGGTESGDNSESADLSDDGESTDPELESSYEENPESWDSFDNGSENRENVALLEGQQESGDTSTEPDSDQRDLDADRKRLDALKDEIDHEYRTLVKEKAELAEEKKKLVNREDVLKYNARVNSLNKRAELYIQKGQRYKELVNAFNERVIRINAAADRKDD